MTMAVIHGLPLLCRQTATSVTGTATLARVKNASAPRYNLRLPAAATGW